MLVEPRTCPRINLADCPWDNILVLTFVIVQYDCVGHIFDLYIFCKPSVLSLMLLMQTILLKPKGIERCQILSVRDTVSKHTNSLTGWFKEIEIF